MSDLLVIFFSIFVLFILFLIVQAITGWRFCALCAGVSTTWLVLLFLYWVGKFQNLILIAPLLGASAVGIYYLAERKTNKQLHVFRLPFFLTLFFVVYFILGIIDRYISLILFLVVIWLIFLIIYFYRNNPMFNKMVECIIACCKTF